MNVFLLVTFIALSLKFYTEPNIWRAKIGFEPIKTKKEYYQRLVAAGEDYPADPRVIFPRWSMFPIVLRPSTSINLVASNRDKSCTAYIDDAYPDRQYYWDPVTDFYQYVFLITNSTCSRLLVSYKPPPAGLAPVPVEAPPLIR